MQSCTYPTKLVILHLSNLNLAYITPKLKNLHTHTHIYIYLINVCCFLLSHLLVGILIYIDTYKKYNDIKNIRSVLYNLYCICFFNSIKLMLTMIRSNKSKECKEQ